MPKITLKATLDITYDEDTALPVDVLCNKLRSSLERAVGAGLLTQFDEELVVDTWTATVVEVPQTSAS